MLHFPGYFNLGEDLVLFQDCLVCTGKKLGYGHAPYSLRAFHKNQGIENQERSGRIGGRRCVTDISTKGSDVSYLDRTYPGGTVVQGRQFSLNQFGLFQHPVSCQGPDMIPAPLIYIFKVLKPPYGNQDLRGFFRVPDFCHHISAPGNQGGPRAMLFQKTEGLFQIIRPQVIIINHFNTSFSTVIPVVKNPLAFSL